MKRFTVIVIFLMMCSSMMHGGDSGGRENPMSREFINALWAADGTSPYGNYDATLTCSGDGYKIAGDVEELTDLMGSMSASDRPEEKQKGLRRVTACSGQLNAFIVFGQSNARNDAKKS